MSLVMEGLFYTKDHEWVRVEGEKAYIGITDYAQHSLGSIVYVELPSVGDEISKDDNLGVVESVKAASDIIMPVFVNEAPYDNHLVIVKLTDADEIEELLSKEDYEAFISEEE